MNHTQVMNEQEIQLIAVIRDLKPFETIEIKCDEEGKVIYTYTQKKRYILLTPKPHAL